jgi:metal-dependent hydrolase (beta-lactamase superfamily II)
MTDISDGNSNRHGKIVDDTSGIINISNERIVPMQGCDHSSICRFASKHSESYKRVYNVLQDWVDELDTR